MQHQRRLHEIQRRRYAGAKVGGAESDEGGEGDGELPHARKVARIVVV